MADLMKPPSIVVLGSWNPAILQPRWLVRNAFGRAIGEEIQVEMQLPTVPGAPPRFKILGLTLVPAADRVTVYADDASKDSLEKAEECVRNILQSLPHTPVQAFGQNLELVEQDPSDGVLAVFEYKDDIIEKLDDPAATIVRTRRAATVRLANHEYFLNIDRELDEKADVTLKFNFHYPVESAEQAADLVVGTFRKNIAFARELLQRYEVRIETDSEEKES